MPKSFARIGLVFAAALALAPAAFAGPVVSVQLGVPTVVVAPRPVVVTRPAVVVRPVRPAPNYVWVEPHWRHDGYGRRVFVTGHWRPQTVVVHRPGPRVIVKKY